MKQRWLHLFTVLCALPGQSESKEQPKSYDGKGMWRDADQQEIYSDLSPLCEQGGDWAWCAIPRENQYMMSRHGFQVKQI